MASIGRSRRSIRVAVVVGVLAGVVAGGATVVGTPVPSSASTTNWKGQLVGVPAGVTTSAARLDLNAVSCVSSTWCMAVGAVTIATSPGPDLQAAAASWNGATWSAVVLPRISPSDQLLGVSCVAVASCVAVGSAASGVGVSYGSTALVMDLAGSTWSATELTSPAGATSTSSTRLRAVSCVAANCVAVGSFDAAVGTQPLAAVRGGSNWQVTAVGLLPPGSTGGSLQGVSCWAASGCVAVGDAVVSGQTVSVADGLSPSGWSPTMSGLNPSVSITGVTLDFALSAVSCPGVGSCSAVGPELVNGLADGVETASLTGGTWSSSIMTFQVADLITVGMANGIACADDTHCLGAGSLAVGDVLFAPSTLVFPPGDVSGAIFGVGVPYGPSGYYAGEDETLHAISCPSTSFCAAVGGSLASGTSSPPTPAIASVSRAPWPTGGYELATAAGAIDQVGTAPYFGEIANTPLSGRVVGIAATADGKGYWMVASDGGIFAFGDAGFRGSMGGQRLNQPIVGMAATADGKGYWMVASDGGVFAFGDAGFHGSMGGHPLNQPIVGMAATADGKGYWLAAADGGIFAFGDAGFHGSMGGQRLNQPIVGMAATADGKGYWMVASDGGIFAFGDAGFHGSAAGRIAAPVVAIVATADGKGYWLAASDGTVDAFGDATWQGDFSGLATGGPVVGMTAL